MSIWKGGLCFFPNSIFIYKYMLLLRWLLSPPGHVLSSRGIFSEGALKEKRKTFFKRTQIWVRKNSNFSNANNHLFHNLRFFFHLYNPNSPTRQLMSWKPPQVILNTSLIKDVSMRNKPIFDTLMLTFLQSYIK